MNKPMIIIMPDPDSMLTQEQIDATKKEIADCNADCIFLPPGSQAAVMRGAMIHEELGSYTRIVLADDVEGVERLMKIISEINPRLTP